MSYCRLIVVGNLTRDPELRYTPQGRSVAQGGIAVNRRWTSEDGQQREKVTFIDYKVWGKRGEAVAQYLQKGRPVLFEGYLDTESWEDKNTKDKRSKNVFIVESFAFVDSKPEEGRTAPPAGRPPASRPTHTAPPVAGDGPPPSDDDVPF